MKIENQLSIFIFHLKKMKIEHRFSFFIFQLAEKMNDPNIHAFQKIFLYVTVFFFNKNEQKTQEHKQGIYNYIFYLFTLSFYFIAGLPRARSARGTEPHTRRIWSTFFRLVVT